MRIGQVPQAIHWDTEPGRVEILLKQEAGTRLPWLELGLALFVLMLLADERLLVPGAVTAFVVIGLGALINRGQAASRPALIRLDWEAQEAEVTYSDGRTATRALKEPGYAHRVKLRSALRQGFATGWEKPDGTMVLVRHQNRSEATNFLRDLARAGWPVHRDEVVLG